MPSEHGNPYADLQAIASLASDAELPLLSEEAATVAERLASGRFYVACVGQFKRGKSSLLNALVDDAVLPVGVTPVTSAVTVLRYGTERRAAVSYSGGLRETIAFEDIEKYVAEEYNHENQRGVTAVEVFLPAAILANGLCLVDTPGIGSAFEGNTEATRAFVPHIDAALVVLGADPPISGDELELVLDVLAHVSKSIFVLNKADRLSADDLRQAREFTEQIVSSRLGRSIGPVLEVSTAERQKNGVLTRDWGRLEMALRGLVGDSTDILLQSRERAVARFTQQLQDDLEERTGALLRPVHESEARIAVLRRSVADAEAMLRELGVLLAAEQRRLLMAFQERQAQFVDVELPNALGELHAWADQLPSAHLRDREQAFAHASDITKLRIEQWLLQIEPEADTLYRNATQRFTALANEFLNRLAESHDPAFAALPRSLEPEVGLRDKGHFYTTSLMHLTAPGVMNRFADVLLSRQARLTRIKRDTDAYLERLLRSNTTRVVFDLEQRVEVSRKKLESELRFLLQQITASAERALTRARVHQEAGQESVDHELGKIEALRLRLDEIRNHAASE